MARLPKRYENQPELVAAVLKARTIQMEDGDDKAMIYLVDEYGMGESSASRCLNNETFIYAALYPEGHDGYKIIQAERRVRDRRRARANKHRAEIIDRDDGRCQACNKRVSGRNVTIDHKDPDGPETLENLHLLCGKCNSLKNDMHWDEFQLWYQALQKRQNERPDFICKNTGLSVRGRSWKEAGCSIPYICSINKECCVDEEGETDG